jgi:Transposase domain (DUF772)
MRRQAEFFEVDDRLKRLSDLGDQLEAFEAAVEFEAFRRELNAALTYSDGTQGGRPPFDPVMTFKILVIQTTNNLSDERAEFLVNDRFATSTLKLPIKHGHRSGRYSRKSESSAVRLPSSSLRASHGRSIVASISGKSPDGVLPLLPIEAADFSQSPGWGTAITAVRVLSALLAVRRRALFPLTEDDDESTGSVSDTAPSKSVCRLKGKAPDK